MLHLLITSTVLLYSLYKHSQVATQVYYGGTPAVCRCKHRLGGGW
jgi:hypothetical protein